MPELQYITILSLREASVPFLSVSFLFQRGGGLHKRLDLAVMTESANKTQKQIILPILIVAGIPLLAAFSIIAYFMWALESETLPETVMDQIEPGMQLAELSELAGQPSEMVTNDSETVTWIYKRSFQWRFVKITLKNDQVIRVIQE